LHEPTSYNQFVNKKRGYLDLDRLIDESHPTVSAIAPLICFASTFTIIVLFRFVVNFGALSARCVEIDQFWYTAATGNWPLVASFFIVLFLLFVWNVLIAFDDWRRSKGTKVMIIVNALAISIALFTFSSLHDSAYFQYHARNGYYEDIKFTSFLVTPRWTEDECTTMQRFAGRWRVIDREIGYYGFDIPALWIELKPWGELLAADATWQTPYEGGWQPPNQSRYSDDKRWRDGYIYADQFGAPWDFELLGDTLILTSSDSFNEWEKSKVTLQRDR